MSSTLTIEHSVNNLELFYADLFSSSNSYYYFIGRTLPWPNDSQPPVANQSYQEMVSVYHDMVFGKLLIPTNNIFPLARASQWANNIVYAQYDTTDSNFFNEQFCIYVNTGGNYDVYKCIDNAGGIPSTSQPSLKPITGCFLAADGYTWKYMYTTTSGQFIQDNFVPVLPNTAVVAAAVPGTIDAYRIETGGVDYQGYNEGLIRSVVSPNQIQLANTAIQVDNFYMGDTLYLKSGLGAGQISNIVAYNGASQIATVNPSFDTFIDMQLTGISGTITQGMELQQITESISYLFSNGFFNIGDTLVQSDIGYQGTILSVNGTNVILTGISNLNSMSVGANGFPLYDTNSITKLTGNVDITISSNVITSHSANASYANLLTLSIGQYIRVGNVAASGNSLNFSNVRRVTSITNANTANVDIAFTSTLVGNSLYTIPNALEPVSTTILQANAIVAETNLTALTLSYSNATPNNSSFLLGEVLKEYSNTGLDLSANAIVSFVNTSTLILSGVQGTFTVGSGVTIRGQSSNTNALVTNISSYPSLTLEEIFGTFQIGVPLSSYSIGNGAPQGAAIPVSYIFIPSDNVEYIVGPTVTISGDGVNADAYAVVNTAPGSIFNITNVIPINIGSGFTNAVVTISAPAGYGSGANISAVVAPVTGHGGDPLTELGARNLGISFNFGNSATEVYKFPNYGSYRRAGIIKNPQYQELLINISPTTRNNLSISSLSNPFTTNEILFQPATNAAAKFLSGNSSIMQIDNINGTFANTGNTVVRGLSSNSTANVALINTLGFAVNGNQPVFDTNGSNAILISVVNSSQIIVSNFGGKFGSTGDKIFDPTINSYATVLSTFTANGTQNSSNVSGLRFNQTSRITLSSNTGPYLVGERVIQAVQSANGLVIDTTHELDITYTLGSGTFSSGITITDTTSGANAISTFVNSTYMKLTGVQGIFANGNAITCLTGSATVNTTFNVLVVGDVEANFVNGNTTIGTINGQTSGAVGLASISGTITNPDLTKNTGEVLYVNDFSPFQQNTTTTEVFTTIFGF